MRSRAVLLGVLHFVLQLVVTFYGLSFMDAPDPAPGSGVPISLLVATWIFDVITFPMLYLVAPFDALDGPQIITLVFPANSVLWAFGFYGLSRLISRSRRGSAVSG